MNLQLNWLEITGVITGFICVYLNTRENIWGWPIGIVSVFCYIFVFYDARLYADMALQVIYVVLGFYGWYEWLYGGEAKKALRISAIRKKELILLVAIGVVATGVTFYFLQKFTDASLPFWDSLTTVFSLAGQYLLARKVLENWLFWIFVDVIYIFVYFYKELYFTSLLYLGFLVLATAGYFRWRKSLRPAGQTFLVKNAL
jgi:nicotinamide mononucleotide transporter